MSKTKKYGIQLTKKQVFFTSIALFVSLLSTFFLGYLIGIRFPLNKKSSHLTSSSQNVLVKSPPPDLKSLESFQTSHTEGEKTIHQFTFYDTLPKRSNLSLTNEKEKVKAKNKKSITATKRDRKKDKRFDQDMVFKRYTIQLGSFQQKEKAYALQNKLKKQGYLVYVTPKKIENRGTWYRVRMGNFETPEEAQHWVSKLGDLSPPPFITSATD